jgi:HK97 family phage prohead protease
MSKRERRFLQSDASVGVSADKKITGYAAVFNKRSHDLGDFVEEIDPHAFDACLATSPDIMGLINHNESLVLGRTTSGTMSVSVDTTGLKYEIDPPNTSYANDLLVSMGRKDISGSSFGFYAREDAWSYDNKTKQNVRRLLKVDIFDTSVVTNGAYPDASSQVRSLFPDDKGHVPEAINSKIAELRATQRKEHRFKNILSAVAGVKWAIQPEKLETICALLNSRAAGISATKEEIQAAMMGNDSVYSDDQPSGVAVIPVYGVISQRMTMMAEFCGGTSCDKLTGQLRAAVADPSVTAIVLDIDSPGGTVTGVPELAAEILKLRDQKQIIGVANGMAASAALWIGASCSKLIVIPSGEVGSIGVYQMHQDVSGALDKAGVVMKFISAGKFKVDGNPYEKLSASAEEDMQEGVNEFYDMFVAGVAAGRGVSVDKVKSDFGQGRMLMAKAALAAGLVDSIQTLDEVVSGLLGTDTTVASVVLPDGSADSGIEANGIVADMGEEDDENEYGCECDCQQCMNDDCENCSMDDCEDEECAEHGCPYQFEDGIDGIDDEDDEEDGMYSSVLTPDSAVALELSPEEIEANLNTLTKAKVMSLY